VSLKRFFGSYVLSPNGIFLVQSMSTLNNWYMSALNRIGAWYYRRPVTLSVVSNLKIGVNSCSVT